jgi:hypothetical protein
MDRWECPGDTYLGTDLTHMTRGNGRTRAANSGTFNLRPASLTAGCPRGGYVGRNMHVRRMPTPFASCGMGLGVGSGPL